MIAQKLFFSIINQNSVKVFNKIRADYLSENDLKIYSFILSFFTEYSKFPEIETLLDKFDLEYEEVKEEPDYLLKEVIKFYKKNLIEESAKKAIREKSIEPYKEAVEKYDLETTEIKSYAQRSLERIDDYDELKKTKGIRYLSTGNEQLDRVLLGFNRTDYILVGGEEGIGKTWFLIRRALDVSKKTSKPILIVSGEMNTSEFDERSDCVVSKISYRKYNRGELSPEHEAQRENSLKNLNKIAKFGKYNLLIKDDCVNLDDIERNIRQHKPGMVFIDGLHLFAKSLDWKDMLYASMRLKTMTRRLKIPVMAFMHLRESIKEESKANVGSFAYFKGARDADVAMVMYQDEFMKTSHDIGIKIVKGRKEGSGAIIMTNVNYFTQEERIWLENFSDSDD